MKLSLKVISEQLTAFCPITSFESSKNPSVLYSFPILYQAGTSFLPDRLYITEANDLPRGLWLRSNIGLIVCGTAPDAYVLQNCSVLCVDQNVSIAALFSYVSEIFWKFKKWETKLHKLLATHILLQAYLESTYPLIHSPLLVCGKNGKVLAHIEEDEHGNIDSSTAFNGQIVPLDQSLQGSELYSQRQTSKKCFLGEAQANGQMWPCFFRELKNENKEHLGCLLLANRHGLISESEKFIINYLGDILEISLGRMVELHGRQLWEGSYLFKDILEGVQFIQSEFQHRVKMHGFSDQRFCCIRLILKQTSLSLPVETICWHINSAPNNLHAVFYDSSIVLFVNLPVDTYSIRELPEDVMTIISNGNFSAGVSHTFSALQDAKFYYQQACKALELGIRLNPDNNCYFFSDYALQSILETSLSLQPARTMCMEGIKKLQDMDRRNGSEYCRTLKLYFENGMNLQKTANDLFIHRSTLTYRLNRIQNDAGIDFDNYQSRLYAMLSLELIENQMAFSDY